MNAEKYGGKKCEIELRKWFFKKDLKTGITDDE